MGAMLFGMAALMACQEPFSVDRHDLRGLRIAALGVHDGVASAAVWSGLGPWHDSPPLLDWTLDGDSIGQGHDVAVDGGGLLELTVTDADGQTRSAYVSVSSSTPALTVRREAVTLGADLSLDARRAAEATPIEHVAPSGGAVRMTLGGVVAGRSARWMSAAGTVLELESDTADLLPEEIRFDDGELVYREPLGDGTYTGLALSIDGAGENDWLWVDAAIGAPEQPRLRHEGRLLDADDFVESGLVAATLVEDERLGVRLASVAAVDDRSEQEPLGCMPDGATVFRVAWIAEGRCSRPDVLGARVVLEVW